MPRKKSARGAGYFGRKRISRFRCRTCNHTFSPRTLKPCPQINIPTDTLYRILDCLTEGCSIRSTARLIGVHPDSVLRILVLAGERARTVLDNEIREVTARYVQVDELWGFIFKKQKRVTPSENGDYGDAWTFVAISEDRLVLCYELGKRDPKTALHFLTNLQERIRGRFQLTTDGWRTYRLAVETVFGADVDFAQLVKTNAASEEGRERYSPSDIVSITRLLVSGMPKFSKISTSFVERSNLTMRMRMRRLTRLTNGFSKKRANLAAALALHFFDYNFRRIHCSLRVTPAMQAGISDHIWEWRELFIYSN